jgi:hypothetical protein
MASGRRASFVHGVGRWTPDQVRSAVGAAQRRVGGFWGGVLGGAGVARFTPTSW